jgi:hypothetical protein
MMAMIKIGQDLNLQPQFFSRTRTSRLSTSLKPFSLEDLLLVVSSLQNVETNLVRQNSSSFIRQDQTSKNYT